MISEHTHLQTNQDQRTTMTKSHPGRLLKQILHRSTAVALVLLIAGCASSTNNNSTTTPRAASSTAQQSYAISPEDVLNVSVWREPELQREIVVRPDGGITFPLIGDIQAAGLTAEELGKAVKTAISDYVPDAVVSVDVVSARGLKIFVAGKVKKPGQFLVGRYVDVLQALTLAGGLTPFADRKNIKILRRSRESEQVFQFNYQAVERGEGLSQNIVLKSGDTVVVP